MIRINEIVTDDLDPEYEELEDRDEKAYTVYPEELANQFDDPADWVRNTLMEWYANVQKPEADKA